MDFDALRAAVVPGAAVVGRWPGLVCVAECADRHVLRKLLDMCEGAAGPEPGRVLARRLAMWLGGPDEPGESLRFGTVAVAGPDPRSGALRGEQWAVFLYGPVGVVVPDRQVALSGAQAVAWTDRLLPRPDSPMVLALEGGPIPPGLVDGVHDLRAGVVPGAGAVLVPVGDGPTGDALDDDRNRSDDQGWADSSAHDPPRWGGPESMISVSADGPQLGEGTGNGTPPGPGAEQFSQWPHIGAGRAHLRPVPSGTNGVTRRGRSAGPLGRRPAGFDFGRFVDTGRRGSDDDADGHQRESDDRREPQDHGDEQHEPDRAAGRSTGGGTGRAHQGADALRTNGAGIGTPDLHQDLEPREPDPSPWAGDGHASEPAWPAEGEWFTASEDEIGTETELGAVGSTEARRSRHGRRDDPRDVDGEDVDLGPDSGGPVEADHGDVDAGGEVREEVNATAIDRAGSDRADETSTALESVAPDGDARGYEPVDEDGVAEDDSAGTPKLGLPRPVTDRLASDVEETGTAAPPPITALRVARIHGAGPSEHDRGQLEEAAVTGAIALDEPRDAPQARGYLCGRGHLNDPRAEFCSICGVPMEEPTGPPTSGPRPPLGLLVFDDGATYAVDAEYLVGRMPEVDTRVTSGALRALALDDPSGAVSRVHAEILVSGWDALLVDAGSRNGTFVSVPGEQGWTQLAAGEAHPLVPGTRVRLGGRSFVFESLSGGG